MARDNPRFASWIKLTFSNMHEKFNFESRLKAYREEYVRRAMAARVKYKVSPRFSSWVEILDPCHRSMWRALEFDSSINHFGKYDLKAAIPCPDICSKVVMETKY